MTRLSTSRKSVQPKLRRSPAPPDPAVGFTIQQAAARTGLSEHTLRYYERAGLLEPVGRQSSSRHRRYSDIDIARLSTLACLRATGMPLDQMRRYFALAARGRSAAPELEQLLQQQERVLQERLEEMQGHVRYVRQKIAYWTALKEGDTERARKISHSFAAGLRGEACQTSDTIAQPAPGRSASR